MISQLVQTSTEENYSEKEKNRAVEELEDFLHVSKYFSTLNRRRNMAEIEDFTKRTKEEKGWKLKKKNDKIGVQIFKTKTKLLWVILKSKFG